MPTQVIQLDGSPYSSVNCGPASIAAALRWATDHDVEPTPSQVRKHIGDFTGGIRPDQVRSGWEPYIAVAAKRGWVLQDVQYRPGVPFDRLMATLDKGHGALVPILYSQVPMRLRGSKTFKGNHAIFCQGTRTYNGIRQIRVYDPLNDGRMDDIPERGPVWYPESVLRDACAGYSGNGKATMNRVQHAERQIIVEPDACADCKAELATAKETIAELVNVIRGIADAANGALADASDILEPNTRSRDDALEGIIGE